MSDLREIVESKLAYCRKRLDQLKISGTETAIEDYKTRIYLLEDIIEDDDEANGADTSKGGLHLQNVNGSYLLTEEDKETVLLAITRALEKTINDSDICKFYELETKLNGPVRLKE